MKEKKHEDQKPAGGGDDQSIFNVEPEPENKNVSVSSGPYLEVLPVAGMAVKDIRRKFKDRFDIDDESQAIIDGNDAREDTVLKAGEALMFVRHAGEKGASNNDIVIRDQTAIATSPEGEVSRMPLTTLMERITPRMDTGACILPTGIKAVLSRGEATIWVWEQAPTIQKFSWIASDSPRPYGAGAKYRNVRIGLPYLVIFGVFARDNAGMPALVRSDECFFRTEPLSKMSDELLFPALLNCSKFGDASNRPLSWICTQHLKPNKDMASSDPADRFRGGFEAVRYCLLETSFNLSSEHHEGNSWYGASKKIDKRIATIEAWEEATKKDPLFVLDVPWIKTKHSVAQVAERIFNRLGAADTAVKSSDDLARIINNG